VAILLLREGQAPESAKELENLIESTPRSFRAQYFLGLALQNMNHLDAAEDAFRAALEINPGLLALINRHAGSEATRR
jgi:Tfp pilus assembly protein PilF